MNLIRITVILKKNIQRTKSEIQQLMNVKGTGIKTTKEFVNTKFPKQYKAWISALPEKSKTIYTDTVDFSGWFPIKEAYIDPVDHIITSLYNNDIRKAAEELGEFSAEYALKGI